MRVLAAGVLWGTVGPAELLAKSPAGPVALGGARVLTGGIVLAAIAVIATPGSFRSLTRKAWLPLLAASCANATFQGAFFTSAARTGAAVATAVTFGLAPVSTGLCERIMLGTTLPRRWMTGTACAVVGCVLMAMPSGPTRTDVLGLACAALAGGCFGVYTVSAKRMIRADVNMMAAVPVTLLISGAALSPWTLRALPALAAPRSLLLEAWLGPVAVSLAYWLFVSGLRHVTAATAGTLSLAEPLVATVLGIGVLGERPPPLVASGSLLLLGGLVLVSVPWPARLLPSAIRVRRGNRIRRASRRAGPARGSADKPASRLVRASWRARRLGLGGNGGKVRGTRGSPQMCSHASPEGSVPAGSRRDRRGRNSQRRLGTDHRAARQQRHAAARARSRVLPDHGRRATDFAGADRHDDATAQA
jgi:drug/metabolite transporter, DME family